MGDQGYKNIIMEALKEDDRLWNEGKAAFNQSLLFDLIDKTDKTVIGLLLQRKETKEKFFIKVEDVYVFKNNDFKFFMEENKINNSHTNFVNQIGLSDGTEFIKNRKEIILNFPFKDCILQGEQSTKEGMDRYFEYEEEKIKTVKGQKIIEPAGYKKKQAKREEVFFNQILAHDEIDRLLDEKAFVNWKRYIKDGVQEVGEIKRNKKGIIKENLLIKGNNLLTLHSLKPQFEGQVKLIYIDPPYNTGNDSFAYNDSFNHSTWLTFMKNRLEAAKDLLKDDGSIFIHLDDEEMAYLKVVCDEIFGRENFKKCISVKTGSESGVNAINVMRGEQLFKVKEHILYYAKNSNKHRFNPIYVKAASFNNSYRLEVKKENGKYLVKDIYKDMLNQLFGQDTLRGLSNDQKQLFFTSFQEYCLQNNEQIYVLKTDIQKSGDRFKEFAHKNKMKNTVEEYRTSDGRVILVYKGGMLTPLKERIVEENGKKYYGTLISDFWWDIGAAPSSEGNVVFKAGKKPERLLKRIISLCSDPGEIVMDFFLGSGSTAAVAMKMNRRFIGIEQLAYGENDSVIRLQNVINGDQTGISGDMDIRWPGGGDFLYFELAKWNERAVEEINNCNNLQELQALFEILCDKYFLYYNVKVEDFKNNIIKEKEFIALSLEEQKRIFLTMLDLNQMYVQKTEMADKRFGIDERDQRLTESFYQGV